LLPGVQGVERGARLGFHLSWSRGLGGQLDDIAVGIAKIDRMDKAVVGDTAGLDTGRLAAENDACNTEKTSLKIIN
jgi:hypothetical protein